MEKKIIIACKLLNIFKLSSFSTSFKMFYYILFLTYILIFYALSGVMLETKLHQIKQLQIYYESYVILFMLY